MSSSLKLRILGVELDATPAEIRAAYKRRALEVHPDKGGTAAAFQQVILGPNTGGLQWIAAFEQLADPSLRVAYDARRAPPAPPVARARAAAPGKTPREPREMPKEMPRKATQGSAKGSTKGPKKKNLEKMTGGLARVGRFCNFFLGCGWWFVDG
eukprot:Skav219852  [mRNA]  locus=scaffold859:584495:585804:- [translate_table: standard]